MRNVRRIKNLLRLGRRHVPCVITLGTEAGVLPETSADDYRLWMGAGRAREKNDLLRSVRLRARDLGISGHRKPA